MNAAKVESAPERIQINLPALYAQINEQRQAGGLTQVEPAIMAVRSTIKFSIRRGRTLRLRGDAVDADTEDVDALCTVLSELFNVQVRPVAEQDGRAVRVLGLARANTWSLPMTRLYDAVNSARVEKGLPAVESAVISVRTRVRYSVVRAKPLNFQDDRLIVDDQDRDFLDNFIATHFNVEIPGGVAALCAEPPAGAPAQPPRQEKRAATKSRATASAARDVDVYPHANGGPRELSLPRLFDRINALRQEKGLAPVEPAVISVRTRVRYSIVRRRPLDFKGELLQVDDDDRDFFDVFITQHFDVSIPGGIAALCEASAAMADGGMIFGSADADFGGSDDALQPIPPAMLPVRPPREMSPVWRYLIDLWRLATYGPLTRISIDQLAYAITLRMHGEPNETRAREVRQRLIELFNRDVEHEPSDEHGIVWLTRTQMNDAAKVIRRDFPIQLSNLRELLP